MTVTSGGIYLGALFYNVLQMLFVGFSDLALTVSMLPVFFKQRDLLFYPPHTTSHHGFSRSLLPLLMSVYLFS
jgi:hypothetical protein